MENPALRQRLLAILAADAAGYARLMAIDDRATVDALDAARAVFRRHALATGGRLVDTAGDSVLAVFETAAGAVSCALAVQDALSRQTRRPEHRSPMLFRIGIHVGDVLEKDDGTVYGDGVNIAARLGDLAKPGGIAVSQTVFSMVARRIDASFEDIGDHRVKNIAHPIRAYSVGSGSSRASLARHDGSGASPPGNVPHALPNLFGRDRDVAALVDLVEAHRVVSIVGTGGIGKTCLARAVANALRNRWRDGAWIVDLAPVSEPALLPATVAQSLGTALPGSKDPQDEVIEAMRSRELLLVLDNCEHLIDAAGAFVDAVATRTPNIRVLTTSQELLKVGGEQLYRLSALAVPGSSSSLADAKESGAVALFVERAAGLIPGFVLDEQNVGDVVEICRRLDGLPLAIELAAGRVPLLGAAGVRERLRERFRMLSGGARLAMRRHQTLRAALDWSHALLTPDERAVFRRIGVFSGGGTLAAAQHAIAAADIDEWAVLEHLGALVDKSLVVVDAGDAPRYRMMESTRAYALEKLDEAGETVATLRRHAEAVLALFGRAHGEAWLVPIQERVERCLPDIDNLRAALEWSAESELDADLHVELAATSSWIWFHIGNALEGKSRCERALARISATTPAAIEARMQAAWSHVAQRTGPSALGAGERAVALYRSLGDRVELYSALGRVAVLDAIDGNIAAAEKAVAEMDEIHDPHWPERSRWLLLFARYWVLSIKRPDDYDETAWLADEMVRLARDAGDAWLLHRSLYLKNLVVEGEGLFEVAARNGRELVALIRRERWAEGNLGVVLLQQVGVLTELGEVDEALDVAREAAPRFAKSGALEAVLERVSLLALKRGNAIGAALALGRSEANSASSPARLPLAQRTHDEVLTELRRVISGRELDRLLADGAHLSNDKAVRIALSS